MKKFYSTAIAVLCSLGVSATINVGQIRSDVADFKLSTKSENVTTGSVMKNIAFKKVISRADAGEEQSIAGEYIIYIGDYYLSIGLGNFELGAIITQEGDKVVISCQYFLDPITAKYDAATGSITFSKEKLGEIELEDEEGTITAYYRFEPFGWDDSARKPKAEDYTATFDPEKGLISFPEDHGFSWVAYSDSRYSMPLGYLRIFDVLDMEYASHWDYLGAGVFTDNAVGPYITNQFINPYEVAVYQSTVNPAMYMVTDPWYGAYEALEIYQFSPTIYLYAEDTENVQLVLQSTGLTYKNAQSQGYYLVTNDGYFSEYLVTPAETPQAFTTLTTNGATTTFTFMPRSLLLAESATGNCYAIGDLASTIVIGDDSQGAGIGDVAIDENAPVEYFNLQGVRIAKPAAGQVVIKRQGSKVTKTLVR